MYPKSNRIDCIHPIYGTNLMASQGLDFPSLLTIPREILDMIVPQLTLQDLKAFSVCSKACRYVSLPELFKNIAINGKFVREFEESCLIFDITPHVRYALLKIRGYGKGDKRACQNLTGSEFGPLLQKLRTRLALIQNFYNLKSLEIALHVHRTLNHPLSCAIFKVLSTYQCSKTLREIILFPPDIDPRVIGNSWYGNGTRHSFFDALDDENDKAFIDGGFLGDYELSKLLNDSFKIESVILYDNGVVSLGEAYSPGFASFGEKLIHALRPKLATLDVFPNMLSFPTKTPGSSYDLGPAATATAIIQPVAFTNVAYLYVNTEKLIRHGFSKIVRRFPNLYELMVWSCDIDPLPEDLDSDGLALKDIARLTKLERLSLIRPCSMSMEGQFSRAQLQREIEYWLGNRRGAVPCDAPPLSALEYVEFGSRFEPDSSIICRITREDRGSSKILNLEWQSVTGGFWETANSRGHVGAPLDVNEYCKDAYYENLGRAISQEEADDLGRKRYENLTVVPGTEFQVTVDISNF